MDKYLGEYLGEIKRTGKQKNWEKWDATKLSVGTKIYRHKDANKRHEKFAYCPWARYYIAVSKNGYALYEDMLDR